MGYIHWNPQIDISILGFSIRWYGILWAVGLIFAAYIVGRLYKANKIGEGTADKLFIYCMIGILAGARLGHCIFYDSEYFLTSWTHLIEMFVPIRFMPDGGITFTGYAGLASHGGAIGALIALWYYSKKYKMKFLFVLDCIAIAAPFTALSIRFGNLINSEIIGCPTDVPWAFIFERVDNIPRHPAQLYEAIFYLLVFITGIIIYRKTILRNSLGLGFFFGYCITSIFTFRFFIEFLKEVQSDFEESLLLDTGQLLSIPFIIIGIYFISKSLKAVKDKLQNQNL